MEVNAKSVIESSKALGCLQVDSVNHLSKLTHCDESRLGSQFHFMPTPAGKQTAPRTRF